MARFAVSSLVLAVAVEAAPLTGCTIEPQIEIGCVEVVLNDGTRVLYCGGGVSKVTFPPHDAGAQ